MKVLSCQECAPGYSRFPDSSHPLGRCEKCNCNNHSSSCDLNTGLCLVRISPNSNYKIHRKNIQWRWNTILCTTTTLSFTSVCCDFRIAGIIQLAIGVTSVRLDSSVTLRSGPPMTVNHVPVLEHHKKTGRWCLQQYFISWALLSLVVPISEFPFCLSLLIWVMKSRFLKFYWLLFSLLKGSLRLVLLAWMGCRRVTNAYPDMQGDDAKGKLLACYVLLNWFGFVCFKWQSQIIHRYFFNKGSYEFVC